MQVPRFSKMNCIIIVLRLVLHYQSFCDHSRLLARVLKEGVQFWYNETSTVKGGGGGGRDNVPLENL